MVARSYQSAAAVVTKDEPLLEVNADLLHLAKSNVWAELVTTVELLLAGKHADPHGDPLCRRFATLICDEGRGLAGLFPPVRRGYPEFTLLDLGQNLRTTIHGRDNSEYINLFKEYPPDRADDSNPHVINLASLLPLGYLPPTTRITVVNLPTYYFHNSSGRDAPVVSYYDSVQDIGYLTKKFQDEYVPGKNTHKALYEFGLGRISRSSTIAAFEKRAPQTTFRAKAIRILWGLNNAVTANQWRSIAHPDSELAKLNLEFIRADSAVLLKKLANLRDTTFEGVSSVRALRYNPSEPLSVKFPSQGGEGDTQFPYDDRFRWGDVQRKLGDAIVVLSSLGSDADLAQGMSHDSSSPLSLMDPLRATDLNELRVTAFYRLQRCDPDGVLPYYNQVSKLFAYLAAKQAGLALRALDKLLERPFKVHDVTEEVSYSKQEEADLPPGNPVKESSNRIIVLDQLKGSRVSLEAQVRLMLQRSDLESKQNYLIDLAVKFARFGQRVKLRDDLNSTFNGKRFHVGDELNQLSCVQTSDDPARLTWRLGYPAAQDYFEIVGSPADQVLRVRPLFNPHLVDRQGPLVQGVEDEIRRIACDLKVEVILLDPIESIEASGASMDETQFV